MLYNGNVWQTVGPVIICAEPIKIKFVTIKDGDNMLLEKEIIIPESTLKIGYKSIKPKQVNVLDTNKTI